uniref:Reverse transcriptase Ty1/copia-type domain-containing protein n=1 Tax=Chromera velia CCMP2878 TaxID=1169474 RepID=A0A0G4FFI4_9ALVE|eukprot:Cvel_16611.t1-p1 / transcript=Cvel_16611.t1 / gene=Cvel_16611 / organism=Chromera_velia_CCMP2878 / gene_product=hypothetical protein / transcript_product=hypothetical protein / location=Cvel_scaffold1287:6077-8149(+) / protein_length=326 / sequence_SO=supercontig / SO=protein_coding / is_pseudo=false
MPGVENAINETVHSTTRFSPNAIVHGVSEGVPPLAVGDVVRFLEKRPIPSGLAPNSRVGLSRKERDSGEGVEDDFDFSDGEDLEFEDDSPANGESVVDSTDNQRERDGERSEERHRDPSPTRHGPLNAVIKRHSSGALVPLQIVRGGQNVRNSLWGVRLNFDTEGNTSIQGAIEEVKLPEIQQHFRLSSDGRLPPEVLDRLVPPEPPPSESREGGGAGNFSSVDIDRDNSLFGSALLEEESYAEKEMDLLRGLIQMDEPEYMDDGDLHAYVGLSIRVKKGEMSLKQSDYIADMVSHLSPDKQKPFTARDLLLDDPEEEMEEGLRRE